MKKNIVLMFGGIVIVGILFYFKRESWPAFLPFLLVLICPLSMLFMMKGMNHSCNHASHAESEEKKQEKKNLIH